MGEQVFADLVENRDSPYLMLDSTLSRAHRQATTGQGSGSKKGASIRLWGVPEAVIPSIRSRKTPIPHDPLI